jgi:hypothetical protein
MNKPLLYFVVNLVLVLTTDSVTVDVLSILSSVIYTSHIISKHYKEKDYG